MKHPNTLNTIGLILVSLCLIVIIFICFLVGVSEKLYSDTPTDTPSVTDNEPLSPPGESSSVSSNGTSSGSPESSDRNDTTTPWQTTEELTTPEQTTGEQTTPTPTTPIPTPTTPVQTTPVQTTTPTEEKPKKLVALTFDDGPHQAYTYELLNVLKKYNVKATFFILGNNAKTEEGRKAVKAVFDAGHEIGNHSYNHPNILNIDIEAVKSNFEKNSDLIYEICGIRPSIIRTPGGKYNSEILSSLDFPLVNWTVDTRDWEHNSPEKSLENLKSQVRDGGIVLMHDRKSNVAKTTELIIEWLYENNYEIVTVSELMRLKGVDFAPGKVYRSSYSTRS